VFPPLFYYHAGIAKGHTLALGEVDQRERVGCRFVVLGGLSKLESVEREK
jgi:hypothetical protein